MIVVVDASVLVGELLRKRGRELIAHPNLTCVVAEEQWDEAEHELDKRFGTLIIRGVFSPDQVALLRDAIRNLVEDHVVAVIPNNVYTAREAEARRRVPETRRLADRGPRPRTRCSHPDRRQRLPRLRLPDVDRRDAPCRAGAGNGMTGPDVLVGVVLTTERR